MEGWRDGGQGFGGSKGNAGASPLSFVLFWVFYLVCVCACVFPLTLLRSVWTLVSRATERQRRQRPGFEWRFWWWAGGEEDDTAMVIWGGDK